MSFEEYLVESKENEINLKDSPIEDVERLTKYMTTKCMLGRPSCKVCPLRGETLYCPPAAAYAELERRGGKIIDGNKK